MTTAYPLAWPDGWPRTPPAKRHHARFHTKRDNGRFLSTREVTVAEARDRLQSELDRMDAANQVLSTDAPVRLDGQVRSGFEPEDPGAAIYFKLNGKNMVLACDRWIRLADNIVALAKHIEAMRGMARWGVGTASQAFTGYQRLSAPEDWRVTLGLAPDAAVTAASIKAAYLAQAARHHPDRGGTSAGMARINAARDAAMRALEGPKA